MINFCNWLEHQDEKREMPKHLPPKPVEKNKIGGFDPDTGEQTHIFKRADLITLPEDVKGTNCGNCRFARKVGNLGFCTHEKVHQWVTPRMCCAFWDNPGARRIWEKNQ